MLKRPAVQAAKSSYYASTGVWRGEVTLHLTMVGEANEEAVHALIGRCRQMIVGSHSVATVVVIDTLGVTGLAVGPGFMDTCRELLNFLRTKGTETIVGVSNSAGVRTVASAVGFGVGIRMRIAATLVEGLALADKHAARRA